MFRKSVVVYSSCLVLTFAFAIAAQAQVQNTIALAQPRHSVSVLDSTKEQDGLVGAVRRVKIESVKIENDSSEGPRELIELTTYGLKGNRIENVSYPVSDPVVGKQEYKYDDRGNITEMTVRNDQGAIVSREAYNYEFDGVGNWIKMVTSLMLFENGKLKREPVETTYRTISYYFTDEVAKIVEAPVKNVDLPAAAGTIAENLEQPNVNFPTLENDKSSAPVGDAPPLPVRPSPPVTKSDEPSAAVTEPSSNAATAGDSGESTTARNRLLNLKRSAEREPVDKPADNPSQVESTANAAPNPVPVNPAPTKSESESAPVNSAPAENSGAAAALNMYEKGLNFLAGGNLKEALGAFLASVKELPSGDGYLNLGNVYLKLEKNSEAEKAFQQAVKFTPENAEAQYGLGLASFRLKRFANARDAFKKATALAPDMAKAHLGVGLSCLELGQSDAQLVEVRILERLDKKLAKQLQAASPQVNCGRFSACQ